MLLAILLSPSEHAIHTGLSMPPGTLAAVTGYQREVGHQVDQYDLDTDLQRLWDSGTLGTEDLTFNYQKDRVLAYLAGEPDSEIDRFCTLMLNDKSLPGHDLVGISLGGSFSWMPIHSGFLLAYFVQSRLGIPVVVGGNNVHYLTLFQDLYGDLWNALTQAFRFIIVGPGHEALDTIASNIHDPAWVDSPGTCPDWSAAARTAQWSPPPKRRPRWCARTSTGWT